MTPEHITNLKLNFTTILAWVVATLYLLSYLNYDKKPVYRKIGNFFLMFGFVPKKKEYLLTFAVIVYSVAILSTVALVKE